MISARPLVYVELLALYLGKPFDAYELLYTVAKIILRINVIFWNITHNKKVHSNLILVDGCGLLLRMIF